MGATWLCWATSHMQEENFEFVANLNINTVDFYQA